MQNPPPSSLTKEQVLAAIAALAAEDLDITHSNIRNQLVSSGFRPTAEDLTMTTSKTFAWLKALSVYLANLREERAIEVVNPGVRKGVKYRLVPQNSSDRPRQMSLPEYSSTEYLATIAGDLRTALSLIGISGEARDTLAAMAIDLEEIKFLLRELVSLVRGEPQPQPEVVVNGNGKNGNGAIASIIEAETGKSNGKRR